MKPVTPKFCDAMGHKTISTYNMKSREDWSIKTRQLELSPCGKWS